MPPRRHAKSGLDQALESYGIRPSLLSGLTPEEYQHFRRLQRIGTRDAQSRTKFDRRSRREEARYLNEHAFIHSQRFREPEFQEFYVRSPGRDGLAELERFYFGDFQKGVSLSVITSDLRGFRKTDKAYARNFSPEEISHVIGHLTVRALRASKLGENA